MIPEIRDWNNGRGIDVESWIDCTGTFQLAIGYSTLFWPRFVEFEGFVLREGFDIGSVRQLQEQASPCRWSIEAVMNHLHIAAMHYRDSPNCTHEQALQLGRVLREIHQAKLAWQFPERRFEVVFDQSPREDVMAYELTFYQLDAA